MLGLICRVVASFDPLDFCYLYGKAVGHRVPVRLSVKSAASTLRRLATPLLNMSIRTPNYSDCNVLLFAATKNQCLALQSVDQALCKKGLSVCWLENDRIKKQLKLSPLAVALFYLSLLCLTLLRPKFS